MSENIPIQQINQYTYQIPQTYHPNMKVPVTIYADQELITKMKTDRTLWQATNVAHLPGIYTHSIVLPDGHEGYGFPIGGVAATDYENGVISPGGVGYDINCGVRLLRTNLTTQDIKPYTAKLIDAIFKNVPSGLGSKGHIRPTQSQLDTVLTEGVDWAIKNCYGWNEDAQHCEENGHMQDANPDKVSNTAKNRGLPQLGSLGSGNHFLEIQRVDKIYNPTIAKQLGITQTDQITVMIHTGSRGLGHQVCSDYLRIMENATHKYNIQLPDRELACAPGTSREAQDYYQAMTAAANYAWTNRQMITHWIRESFQQTLNKDPETLDMHLIYDVAHNIAKKETHNINNKQTKVWTHRKGATRSYPPNHPDIPRDYQNIGQPVLIPGAMSTASYLMIGTAKAMEISFGSTAHGAGRVMSREGAKRRFRANDIIRDMESHGILVRSASMETVVEEAGGAYKDIDRVAEVSDKVGIAKLVARFVPLAVTKG
jgi:tRNA-splicing ligase RtcB